MTKENYLNNGNLENKTQSWLANFKRRKLLLADDFAPSKSALLVVDVQDFFFNPDSHAFIPSSPHIIENIKGTVACFRRMKRPLIFSRHAEDKNAPEFPANRIWSGRLLDDYPLSNLCGWLPVDEDDFVFKKKRYSAFFGTNLDKILRESGVEFLFIAGVASHVCVLATAIDAFMHGYLPVVIVDGCASWNEEQHLRALQTTADAFGLVCTLKTIKGTLR